MTSSPPHAAIPFHSVVRPVHYSRNSSTGDFIVEASSGPLGTLWVSMGLIAFYLALIWLNTLLGVFLTPLFLIPGTWLMDKVKDRKARKLDGGQTVVTRSNAPTVPTNAPPGSPPTVR